MTRTVPVHRLISFLTFALGLSLALPSHAVTVAEAVAVARNTQLPDIDGIMANHDGVLDAVGGGSTEGLDDVKNLWADGKGTLTGSAEATVIECRDRTDTTCRAIQVLDKGFPERPSSARTCSRAATRSSTIRPSRLTTTARART